MSSASASLVVEGPSAVATPERVSHRPDIQGLRAVAILLVVVYHAAPGTLSGGFIGVDVFFVISGFVITKMLAREHEGSGRISLRSFYLRRVRRILPALAVTTSMVMIVSVFAGSIGAQSRTIGTGIAASLFSANIYLVTLGKGGYFHAAAATNPLLHTWSLSLEEQFYLVFPALLVGAALIGRRRGRGRTAFGPAVLLLSAISFALCVVITEGVLPDARLDQDFAFFMAPTRVWQFGAGALLALAWTHIPRGRLTAEAFGWSGAALVAFAAIRFDDTTLFPGAAAVIPTLGAALLIAAGAHESCSLARGLSLRPMTTVGDLSYSWYLWHWPAIVFAAAVANRSDAAVLVPAAVLSLVPAVMSYRLLEQPIRRRPAQPRTTVPLAALCIGGPVVLGLVLVPVSRVVERSDAVSSFQHQTRLHADAASGCSGGRTEVPSDRCTWTAPRGGAASDGGVGNVLVGDSNAGQFSEAFIESSHAQGRDATVQTRSACPFADLTIVNGHLSDEGCRRFVRAMVDRMVEIKPDAVVISAASDRYIEDTTIGLIGPDGRTASSVAEKTAAWETGLGAVVDRLTSAGIPVTIVMPVPKFLGWDPHACATGRILVDAVSCGTSAGRAGLADRRAKAVAAQRRVAERDRAHVSVIDPFDVLCPDDPCSTYRGDRWWWRDGNHVTVHGARAVKDQFDAALARG